MFNDDEDRIRYLEALREASLKHFVSIWAYALMPNHTHAIVVPDSVDSLSRTFRDAHSVYAGWFNRKYGLIGHLWQARFYSCVMDESHLWVGVKYVERNPVRAGIVSRAEDYHWSSAPAHVGLTTDPVLDPGLPLVGSIANWSEWLAAEDVDDEISAIRQATSTGRPFGGDDFIDYLEETLGHRVRAKKTGKKVSDDDRNEPQLF